MLHIVVGVLYSLYEANNHLIKDNPLIQKEPAYIYHMYTYVHRTPSHLKPSLLCDIMVSEIYNCNQSANYKTTPI